MLGLVIRKSQVKVAVPVEVASGDVIGNVSDGKGRARGRREAPPAVTEEDRGIAALFVCTRPSPLKSATTMVPGPVPAGKRPSVLGGGRAQPVLRDKYKTRATATLNLLAMAHSRNQGRVDSIACAGSA